MDQRRIRKLRGEIAALRDRGNSIRAAELKKLAEAIGRKANKRGKHLTFIGGPAGTFPISIPDHPGAMKRFTAGNILDQLEADLDAMKKEDEGESETDRKEIKP